MKNYTVSIYTTIEAKNEKEAQEIASGLEASMRDNEIDGVFWDSINTEVEEEKE